VTLLQVNETLKGMAEINETLKGMQTSLLLMNKLLESHVLNKP